MTTKSGKSSQQKAYAFTDVQTTVVNDSVLSYTLSDDNHILSLIETLRKGIKYLNFNNIANNIPFSMQDWSHFLQLSDRTMQRYKKEKKSSG